MNRLGPRGQTALIKAVHNGHLRCVRLLLTAGANVNQTDRYGYSPLLKAVQHAGHEEERPMDCDILSALLQSGADVNKTNAFGDYALFIALKEANVEAVKILIDAGDDVNKTKEDGKTALMAATEGVAQFLPAGKYNDEIVQCIQILLKSGAHVNKTNKRGLNALEYLLSQSEAGANMSGDIFMLLYAAGERIDPSRLNELTASSEETNNNNNAGEENLDLPEELAGSEEQPLSLMCLSRRRIREQLLLIQPHDQLFPRVAQLQAQLPQILASYLLYHQSLPE